MQPSEKEHWHEKTTNFMKRKAEQSMETAKSKAKRAKSQADVPRKAAWGWLMNLQNSFETSLGFGLERWYPEHRPFDDDMAPAEAEPSFLVGCFDQENLQWSAAYFMQNKLDCQAFFFPGPMHRLDNDCDRAVIGAGEYMTMLLSMCCGNIVYGPWANQEHYETILETAWEAVAALDPNNPFLMFMWPRICRDRHWTTEEETNEKARAAFLRDLAQVQPISIKGPRASTSRWMSMHSQAAFHDRNFHTRLFVFVLVCIMKGWETCWEDIFDSAGAKISEGSARSSSSSQHTASASSSSSSTVAQAVADAVGGNAAAHNSKNSKSVAAQKKDDINSSRSSLNCNGCVNMLHACARLLAKPDFVERLRLIVDIFRSLRHEHTSTISQMRTPEGTLRYYVEQAQWRWLRPLSESLMVLTDLDQLARAGFTTDLSSNLRQQLNTESPQVVLEDTLATRTFAIIARLLTERCGSMARYSCTYPFKLARVAAYDEAERQAACAEFAADWRAYVAGRSVGLAKHVVGRSSLNTRAMHDVARFFRQHNWQANDHTIAFVKKIFGGFMQEKICEDVLKHCRESEQREQSSGVVRQWRIYDSGSKNSVIQEWGRQEITIEEDMFPEQVVAEQFVFSHDGKPRQAVPLEKIKEPLSWLTWDAQTIKRQSAVDELTKLAHTSDDWDIMLEAWKARVVPERCFLINRAKKEMWYSVFVCEYMVLAWPCIRVADMTVALDKTVTALSWKVQTCGIAVPTQKNNLRTKNTLILQFAPSLDIQRILFC